VTWPGRKQVFRRYREYGTTAGDVVGLEGEDVVGTPLLRPVMRGGQPVPGLPDLDQARAHAAEELRRLPLELRLLEPFTMPVEISRGIRSLAERMDMEERR
jgi:nicotinate phosphoribosyltransferase